MLYFISFALLILKYQCTNALLSAEGREALKSLLIPAALKCVQQEGIPNEFFEDDGNIANKLTKSNSCLYACIFKTVGLLGEDGKYNPKEALQALKPFMPEDITMCREAMSACTSVNDVKVKDSTKGCERALLLIKCMKAKSMELDLLE